MEAGSARRKHATATALVLAAALGGCASWQSEGPPDPDKPYQLTLREVPAPDVLDLDAQAVRDQPDGAAGLWAVVPKLARPERARVVNSGTRAEVVVALFRGGRPGQPVRLSNEAADALEIEAGPVEIRLTAVREKPLISTTHDRF